METIINLKKVHNNDVNNNNFIEKIKEILEKPDNIKYINEELFIQFIKKGEIKIIEILLTHFENFIKFDPYNLLYHACINNQLTIVKFLLNKFNNILDLKMINYSLVMDSLIMGHIEIYKLFLSLNYHIPEQLLKLILIFICEKGNTEVLINILNISNTTDIDIYFDDNLLLQIACEFNHLNLVKYLLETFPNFDIHCNKETPFLEACRNGNLEIMQYLYQKDNTINLNINNEQPLYLVCKFGSIECIEYLESICKKIDYNVNDNIILILLCAQDNLEIIKKIYKKSNVNGEAFTKMITQSCTFGKIDILEWIIALDNSIEYDYREMFDIACFNNQYEIAAWIYTKIKISFENNNSYFIFSNACAYDYIKIVEFFINNSLINYNDYYFLIACQNNSIQVSKLLYELYKEKYQLVIINGNIEDWLVKNILQIKINSNENKNSENSENSENKNSENKNTENKNSENKNTEINLEDCSICTSNKCNVLTECNHSFCYECLNKWYCRLNNCPLCKNEINFVYKN